MSTKKRFDRIVAGQGVYDDIAIPSEWIELGLGRSFPQINPASAVAQIAIEQASAYSVYREAWDHLDMPKPIETNRFQSDKDSGVALMMRRRQNNRLETISNIQHVFRMQYRGIVSYLGSNFDHQPEQRFTEALEFATQNSLAMIDRIYFHEPEMATTLSGTIPELEFFYSREQDLHFQDLLNPSR